MTAEQDPRGSAGIELLRRSGVKGIEFRITDAHEEFPVVVVAIAHWGGRHFKVGCGPNHVAATLDLCEKAVDGGRCTHCLRTTAFLPTHEALPDGAVMFALCRYQWDPELKTFRRECEGNDR